MVRDLDSRNGTTVNGRLIRNEEVRVQGKATVQIGPYILTLATEELADETMTVAPQQREAVERLKLDRGLHALIYGDRAVIERLSTLEYKLTDVLDEGAPNVVENTSLDDKLWGSGQWDVCMLHNLVRRLRRKLTEQGIDAEEHFVTVPGVGYRLA